MIIRPKTNWFRMLFAEQGSVQHSSLLPLTIIFILSMLALAGHHRIDNFFLRLNPVPFSLIGVALAIFTGFRNNVCYDRYWEGRKLWGCIMACSRDLVRHATTLSGLSKSDAQVRRVAMLLVAFSHLLKHQLRETDGRDVLKRLLNSLDEKTLARLTQRHCRPQYVLQLLQEQFVAWHYAGRLSGLMLQSCLESLTTLTQALGSCERLFNTPVPYAYDVLLHRTTYFYCALLPFGLVESVGWMTPIIAVFISYAFLTVHTIASELEEPFGEEANDLPLDALSINIERALLEGIEAEVPPALVPDRRYRLK